MTCPNCTIPTHKWQFIKKNVIHSLHYAELKALLARNTPCEVDVQLDILVHNILSFPSVANELRRPNNSHFPFLKT
jgi:hypothetical protein